MSLAPDSSSGPLDRRRAGVLLHPTSLPAGDLGAQAHDFVDFLAAAGATVVAGAAAGADTRGRRLAVQLPVRDGRQPRPDQHAAASGVRHGAGGAAQHQQRTQYDVWCTQQADWLEAYVEFTVLRDLHGGEPWQRWEPALRDRDPAAVAAVLADHDERVRALRLAQWVFDEQWRALRTHAASRGVLLFGDLPIFVSLDSADVWARAIVPARRRGSAETVAGVPPDYFAATASAGATRCTTGTRDGRRRLRVVAARGSPGSASWSTSCGSTTSAASRRPGTCRRRRDGQGRPLGAGPGAAVSRALVQTPGGAARRRRPRRDHAGRRGTEVRAGLPGMKVLQFAFDGAAENPYLPERHGESSVVYTGTHDNDTTLGWWESLTEDERALVRPHLLDPGEPMPWALIRLALSSTARLAVVTGPGPARPGLLREDEHPRHRRGQLGLARRARLVHRRPRRSLAYPGGRREPTARLRGSTPVTPPADSRREVVRGEREHG